MLIDGNRLFIGGLLTAGIFLLLLMLAELDVIAFVNDDSITRMAGGMIAGTFSLITLVVSINQLILSREFTSAAESRDHLDGILSFRTDVANYTDNPTSPAAPSTLLAVIAAEIRDNADRLNDTVDDEAIAGYSHDISRETARLARELESAEFGTFRALSPTIGFDVGRYLYVGRHLRETSAEATSSAAISSLEDILTGLEMFAVAREYLKTNYLQREVTRFSQLTILTGIPAVLAAIGIGLIYADFGGATIATVYLPVVTSALIAIVVTPLGLLTSYILRTATVTRRTASLGPTVPDMNPEEELIDE